MKERTNLLFCSESEWISNLPRLVTCISIDPIWVHDYNAIDVAGIQRIQRCLLFTLRAPNCILIINRAHRSLPISSQKPVVAGNKIMVPART
jgi:hypothetical protein